MTQQITNILDRAAELIETKGWTQGAYARGKDGKSVGNSSKLATCYCIAGAIDIACEGDWRKEIFEFIKPVCGSGYFLSNLIKWNDDPARTKEDVVAALKSAAELARKEAHD